MEAKKALDLLVDVAFIVAVFAVVALIWTGALAAGQVIATCVVLGVVGWFLAGRVEHGRQRAPTFRAPRPTRRDTISQPTPPTVESEDQWEAIERDTGRPEEAGGTE
jgi:hypothetical protein